MNDAGYRFLDEIATADVAFQAWGRTLGDVFAQAARATVAVMVEDLGSIHPHERRRVELSAESGELLLFDFLQEVIFHKDAESLLLLPERIEITPANGPRLTATLAGQAIDRQRHATNADVKAVTMHRFRLWHESGLWRTETVLDI